MISVAMATYNGSKYLSEQIDSILNQSVQFFEIVVCDDCSTDGTFELLIQYAQKDQRFKIFKNDYNLGFKKNFERAISLCSGDFIALSDQDDIWLPDHLKTLMETLGDKMLACGNSILVDENNKDLGVLLSYQESLDYVPKDDLLKAMSVMLFRNPYQGAAMLFRKELAEIACPIPDVTGYHDKWLVMVACMTKGMNFTFEPIMRYRRLRTSVTDMRLKRKSKIMSLRNHVIFGDRLGIARALKQITPRSRLCFLEKMEAICMRNNSFIGRWKNFFYMIRHYRTIYSCGFIHWL